MPCNGSSGYYDRLITGLDRPHDGLGGQCPYAEPEWCCVKVAGHDGPHESAYVAPAAALPGELKP